MAEKNPAKTRLASCSARRPPPAGLTAPDPGQPAATARERSGSRAARLTTARISSGLSARTASQSAVNAASSRTSPPPGGRSARRPRPAGHRQAGPARRRTGWWPAPACRCCRGGAITQLVGSGVLSRTRRRSPARWLARWARGCLQHGQADRAALVDQRGVADDSMTVPGELDRSGDGAEDPAGRAGAGELGRGRGQGLVHLRGELLLQRGEILADRQRSPPDRPSTTANRTRRWSGTPIGSQSSSATRSPVSARSARPSACGSAPAASAGWSVQPVERPAGVLRRGHEVAPDRLGQRPDQLGGQLGPQPGHLPAERGRGPAGSAARAGSAR